MAAFVYYNPKTNTIERKFPTQPMTFQMPYLLNIQPQDINLAMRNTVDLRANPPNFHQPTENFQPQYQPQRETVENFKLTKKVEKEVPKMSSIPRHLQEENPSFNQKPATNEFLMMEDLREEDLNVIPGYYQAPGTETEKRSFKPQSFESQKKSTRPNIQQQQQNYAEEEARGDFKLVRHEDIALKYRPEDYSINERILNAKYVREEQEKTKKFIMDRIGNDIKAMEKATGVFEKEMQQTEKDTQDLEEKSKQIWEEVERKKFELKAQEIMNQVDRAVEIGHELEDEDRINQLFKENKALYAEIDRVLDGADPYEEGPTQYSLYTIQDTNKSTTSRRPGTSVGRGTSQNRNPNKPEFNVSKSIVEQKFGRKNIVKTVSENKIKGATRVQIGSPSKKKPVNNKQNTMFKNPKKVEDALQRAREIADLY